MFTGLSTLTRNARWILCLALSTDGFYCIIYILHILCIVIRTLTKEILSSVLEALTETDSVNLLNLVLNGLAWWESVFRRGIRETMPKPPHFIKINFKLY